MNKKPQRWATWPISAVLYAVVLLGAVHAADAEKPSPGGWPTGTYRWYHSANSIPTWLAPDDARQLFLDAAKRWETCGVQLEYQGETTVSPGAMDGINVVGWSLKIPPKLRGLTVGRAKEGVLLERDVAIRPDRQEFKDSGRLLEKVITHELGHAIGLTHSSRCNDVMTLAADCPKADPETLPIWPTDNDIQRCRAIYGR